MKIGRLVINAHITPKVSPLAYLNERIEELANEQRTIKTNMVARQEFTQLRDSLIYRIDILEKSFDLMEVTFKDRMKAGEEAMQTMTKVLDQITRQ